MLREPRIRKQVACWGIRFNLAEKETQKKQKKKRRDFGCAGGETAAGPEMRKAEIRH